METIKIAGVECRVDKLNTSTYESLFNSAIQSDIWKGVKNAKELIDKELKTNGFKPVTEIEQSSKSSDTTTNRGDATKRNTRKPRRNSKSSKK